MGFAGVEREPLAASVEPRGTGAERSPPSSPPQAPIAEAATTAAANPLDIVAWRLRIPTSYARPSVPCLREGLVCSSLATTRAAADNSLEMSLTAYSRPAASLATSYP